MDKHLFENDILCLTKTQFERDNDRSISEPAWETQYSMHFNTSLNKFKSIAYGYSNQITFLSNEDFDGIFIVILRKQQLSNNPISLALI